MLHECQESVAAQTYSRIEHLVGVDHDREGPQTIRNRLAGSSDADWFLPLDDDDLLDPTCVQRLVDAAIQDGVPQADVVWPWCRMHGRTDGWVPNKLWNADSLHKQNYIPCTALIRADAYRLLAGYKQVPLEDWDMWRRAELHDLRFRCVPEVLWTYRQHAGQNFQREAA